MRHEPSFQFQATAPATAAHCRALIVADMKALFADPSHWCQGLAARTVTGEPSHVGSAWAHSYDIWGALYASAMGRRIPYYIYDAVLTGIAHEIRAITGRPPAPWNDDPARTHADILELMEALPD